jgi:hypothetical protein
MLSALRRSLHAPTRIKVWSLRAGTSAANTRTGAGSRNRDAARSANKRRARSGRPEVAFTGFVRIAERSGRRGKAAMMRLGRGMGSLDRRKHRLQSNRLTRGHLILVCYRLRQTKTWVDLFQQICCFRRQRMWSRWITVEKDGLSSSLSRKEKPDNHLIAEL